MQAPSQIQEFHPELTSRRGELIAWGSTLLVAIGWVVLAVTGNRVPGSVPFLGFLLLLAALSISLGNWMDRRTRLQLGLEGISFQNGLRRVHLKWDEIRQVQVYPSKWGQRVSVIGPDSHFEFRTLGEVKVQGEVKGRMGFAEGERILQQILAAAGLVPKPESHSTDPYYYVRK
jgi:hypothetical protein